MQSRVIRPHGRLLKKYFIEAGLVYGIPAAGALVLFFALMAHHGIGLGERPGVIFLSVFGSVSAVVWLLLVTLIPPFFRSISYELTDREIVVRKGIVTKVVKTVPYRTITNIMEARDIADRYWVSLGSVKIQTAGMSGQTGFEASLDGLEDWSAVNKEIQDRLREFRGAMSPTAAEVESQADADSVLAEILDELKAIRGAVEKKC